MHHTTHSQPAHDPTAGDPMNTTDTASATTLADELRTAATLLRCDHSFPCNPPGGTLWAPGPCTHCGMPYPADDEWIPEPLRKPLATWLAFEANIYQQIPADRQGACTPEHALAVARAINGGAR